MDKKKDGIGVADGARDGQRERERHCAAATTEKKFEMRNPTAN